MVFHLFFDGRVIFEDFRFVVRSGMNFGMDYSVYRLLPNKCHSEFCVQVVDARSNCNISQMLSWRHISTITRVMPVSNRHLLESDFFRFTVFVFSFSFFLPILA